MKHPRADGNAFLALAVICLSALMFGLEISSVPVVLPTLQTVLHGSFSDTQWIMNAYTIGVTTVLMATGSLADRFGRKRVLAAAVAAFGATSLVCGLATTTPLLIAARFLQGASGGAMLICQIAILAHRFPDGRARARAFGVWGIVFGAGLGLGPAIGGLIVEVADWRWVFLVHVGIALLTLPLLAWGVRESRDPHATRVDVLGLVTLSSGIFGLAFVITRAPTSGLANPAMTMVLGLTLISLVGFVVAERVGRHPMFDFSVFRNRRFSGALLGSAAMNFSFWPLMIYLPAHLEHGLGHAVVTASTALLAYTLPTLVLPPLAERLLLRLRAEVVIPAGLFVIGCGFFLMWIGSGTDNPTWADLLPGMTVAGIGLGLANTPVTNTTTGSLPTARAGMASGLDMTARMTSLAINISMMGLLLTAGVSAYLRAHLPERLPTARLRSLTERVANGDDAEDLRRAFPELRRLDPTDTIRAHALIQGFELITLYGGIAVWLFAAASWALFRSAPIREKEGVEEAEQMEDVVEAGPSTEGEGIGSRATPGVPRSAGAPCGLEGRGCS
ncbi:MFS transporter [Embleya sp. NPDC050154]|uniref:MFS transporter n=1 Tax=Embleya sp. NPDC050154 TaxID=3363988 RepID=UPI003798D0C3